MKRRILFVCSGNCVRSQMAEAILKHLDPERFQAFSGGTCETGFVHEMALAALRSQNIPYGDLRSKSWKEFEGKRFDAVIVLCDDAAREAPPPGIGPAQPRSPLLLVHWSVNNPDAEIFFTEAEQQEAFNRVCRQLIGLLKHFSEAPDETLRDDEKFASLIREITQTHSESESSS